jgi:hypothetical protein
MSLEKTVIDKAVGKKYTEFSDSIKAELYTKIRNHPNSVAYASEYDKVQTIKQKFADISDQSEE